MAEGLTRRDWRQAVGPAGTVYAVEIAPRFLEYIGQRAKKAGARNVKVVKGTATSVELPAASVDLVFLCDTYHHFETPQKNLASIRKALRAGGELRRHVVHALGDNGVQDRHGPRGGLR